MDKSVTGPVGTMAADSRSSPSHIVYIDPSDANKIKAKNGMTGKIEFSDTNSRITLNNVLKVLSTTGGQVFLKKGTYIMDAAISVGAPSYASKHVILKGESRGSTIIQFDSAAAPADIIVPWCNFSIDSITLDGNQRARHLLATGEPIYVSVNNCHFKNSTMISFWTGSVKGEWVTNNYFDNTDYHDQHASGALDFALIENNYFDRRAIKTQPSSCLTFGGTRNIVVRGNVFDRPEKYIVHGISLEAFGTDYRNVIIDGNVVVNGTISISTDLVTKFSNINIVNNVLDGGQIRIYAQSTTDYTGLLSGINIMNNNITNARQAGIILVSIDGAVILKNNQIRNSNKDYSSITFDKGLISISHAKNIEISGNILSMTDTTQYANPFGIKFEYCTNMRCFDNTFNNLTTNPTVQFSGTNTNFRVWDNDGYATNNEGMAVFSGNRYNTDFTISHGLAVIPDQIQVTPCSNDAKGIYYVSQRNLNSFTIRYASPPPSGKDNIEICWRASRINYP
jgi:hypothetical protein